MQRYLAIFKQYLTVFRQFWTRKRLLYIGIPLLFVISLVTLASQRWAVQWVVEQVVAAKGEKITFEGVSGTMFHELKAEKVVYEGKKRDVTVKGLVFRWNPLHLLHGKADIDELTMDALEIDLKHSDDELLKLPESVAPPVSLEVRKVELVSLSVKQLGVGVTLENVRGSLSAEDGVWQLQSLTFDSPFGNMAMDASLEMEKPFALKGKARFDNEDPDAHLALDVGGTLDKIELSGSLNGYGATGQLNGVVTLFEPFMFKSLDLTASGIDPSKMDESWPVAQFGADIHIRLDNNRAVSGSLKVTNDRPGVFEKHMLPIHAVRAELGGHADVVDLSPLVIDLGAGGSFSGTGRFSQPETTISLKTGNFNLHGITEMLRPTHAAGTVGYHRADGVQEVTVDLGESHIRLKADVLKKENLLELKEGLLSANGGSMSMTGHLNLDKDRDFALKGAINHFNLAALGSLPSSNLNVGFNLSGALNPELTADVDFAFGPSTLFNQPISGKGQFHVRDKSVKDAVINLALGANTFNASGNLGPSGGQISWRLNAPALGVIGHGFKGSLVGSGTLSGSLDDMQGSLTLTGSDFMLMDTIGAGRLQLDADFGTTLSGKIDARLSAGQVTVAGTHWASANVQMNGTWHSHTLEAALKSSHFDLTGRFSGGLTAGGEWVGTIEELENRGAKPFILDSRASLRGGNGILAIEDMTLNLTNGQINIDKLIKKHSRLETSGNAHGVPFDWVLSMTDGADDKVQSTLELGAEWFITADQSLNGEAHIYRENGDITMLGDDHRMRLKLNTLDLRAVFSNSHMNVRLKVSSDRIGETDATFNTRLSHHNGNWGLSKDSPLQMSARSEMPSIGWLSVLTGQPDMTLSGSLSANVTGAGTLGNPRLSGTIALHDLGVDWLSAGIHLKNGELQAALDGSRLTVTKGIIYGDEGNLQVTGTASMHNGMLNSHLKLHTEKLKILSNVDRQAVVTGDGMLTLDDHGLGLTGNWHVDRAKIVLANTTSVTRSKDVIVLGRAPKKAASALFRFNIHADLGNHFYLEGMGVETRLAGQIAASSTAGGTLQLNGNINTVDGVFNAYGQKLFIKKGVAHFTGTPDNPSINVVAVKLFDTTDDVQEVGVKVTGTAQSPNIKLYSKPDVPDSEKISWLVLGYGGGENGSSQQRSALAAAAAALISAGPTGALPNKLAGALGVDIGFASSSLVDDTVLSLSRRIASNLYLSYEQGLTGAISLIKLRYKISRRLSAVGQTGTITAFDLLYDWKFD